MGRLTKRAYGEITYSKEREFMCGSFCNNCSVGTGNCDIVKAMVEKLAELEDLEEQGRLLRLPCKVGDIVYKQNPMIRQEIVEIKVESIFITESGINISGRTTVRKYSFCCKPTDFGKAVFCTKEEIEAKLKEMEKNHEV